MENEALRLRDGGTVVVREIEPGDVDRLRRMFFRLSPSTVHRRFFHPVREPSLRTLTYLATVDHERRQAVVALDGDEIVAVARYDRADRTGDGSAAEVAVVVEDAWQGRGLGRALLRRLGQEALRHGVTRVTASVLSENAPALGLLTALLPERTLERAGPEVLVSAPISAAR